MFPMIKTPVALIRGHLEALEADPESRNAYMRIALREADRLERLVDDLFQLTRLESHRLELDIAPFDAGFAVRSAVESLIEPARREAGLTVMANVAPGDLTCLGDRLRIEQVLLNLIRNAIHFTPEGGIILVTADRDLSGQVQITVRDTGVGIAQEHLAHVFDRFYRADESRTRSSGGAGLGLAIAKELVEAMGGTIAVESEEDEEPRLRLNSARWIGNAHSTDKARPIEWGLGETLTRQLLDHCRFSVVCDLPNVRIAKTLVTVLKQHHQRPPVRIFELVSRRCRQFDQSIAIDPQSFAQRSPEIAATLMSNRLCLLHQCDNFGRIRLVRHDEEVGDHRLTREDEPRANEVLGKAGLGGGERLRTFDYDDLGLAESSSVHDDGTMP